MAPTIFFTMAAKSGMARFAAELANGAPCKHQTVFVAPPLDHEPSGVTRLFLPVPGRKKGRLANLVDLISYNLAGARAAWRAAKPGATFIMVDLFSTVPLSALPGILAKLRGATTVLNLHDFYPHAQRYPRVFHGLERLFYRISYRAFDIVAATTADQVRRLIVEVGCKPTQIIVIGHGQFPLVGVRHPAEGSVPRLLVMGAIRRNKSTLLSIAAYRALVAEHVEVDLRLVGAPRPEERSYWADCRALLDDDVEQDIRFIPEDELPQVYSGIDAVLCPYVDFESQSGVAVMAVSNCVPLIATAQAVPPALLDLPDAWTPIATPISAETIARAIRRFLAMDPAARASQAQLAQAAFARASDWSVSAAAMIDAAATVRTTA